MRILIAAALIWVSSLQQAHADIVVIVSANSTVSKLSPELIARIFQGKSHILTPFDLEHGSHVRRAFYTSLVGQDDAAVRTREQWSKLVFAGKRTAPKEFHSGADLVTAVAADPNAIGYVDSSFITLAVKVIYTVKVQP
jgi:ABC-type phosphate transport system substrate-binding protein